MHAISVCAYELCIIMGGGVGPQFAIVMSALRLPGMTERLASFPRAR